MTRLRLIAASFVLLSSALLPALFASPSQAADSAYTLDQYSAQVQAATDAVTAAQTAVDVAQTTYDNSSIPVVTSTGSGITVKVYNNTTSRTPNEANLCKTDTVAQIAADWGSGSVMGCNNDRVTVHYYGTITVPDSGPYSFRNIADDGWYLTINGQVVNNDWRDKGCNGSWSPTIQLTAGTAYTLDAWYYENGGGACSTLYVTQPSGNWQVVPSSWFGQTAVTTYQKDPAMLDALNQRKAELQAAQDALAAIPAMTISAPTDLVATVDGATVILTWNAPTTGLLPERYAVMWTVSGANGWGVASTTTSITLDSQLFSSTGGWDKDYTFTIRSDQDTAQLYSKLSNAVSVHLSDPTPVIVPEIPPVPVETPTATAEPTPSPSPSQTATPEPSSTPQPQPTPTQTTETQSTDTSTSQTSVETQTATSANPPVDPTPQPVPPVQPDPVVRPDPVVVPASPAPEPKPVPEEKPTPQPDPVPVSEKPSDVAPAPADAATDTAPTPPDPSPQPTEPTPKPKPDSQPQPLPAPIPAPQPPVPPVVQPPVTPPLSTHDQSSPAPSSPDNLPTTIPLVPPASALVPRVQVDKPGVANGGIQFFGTKSQPQVVGEDGKLTPPAPPPGSGLPIPPEAITTVDTFIGQPGGTSFNAPDIAVPVIEQPVTGALAAVPGVQALNHAFVAMANIGNDMSPVTRKKAKKILVITTVIAAVRRKFGN